MHKFLSAALVATFFLSACLAPTEAPTPSGPTDSLSAVVGELAGNVNGKPSAVETLAPINLGFTLRTGGQVQTGDASKARLDFSDRTILRVAANSAYTLEGMQTQANGNVLAQVELSFGRLWVSLTGGELQVRTPVAVASVRGSFAIFVYEPGDPNNPNDDLLVIDCLEGSCTAVNPSLNEQLGNLERLVISPQGSLKQLLAPQDVQAFVLENPESGHLVATLTAAPPATATPTSLPSATPTFTLTPASDTPAVVAPSPTGTMAAIGTHTVRAGETLNCIGRGYGVLPEAIATSNNLAVNAQLNVGNQLLIPRVQWTNISPGPVCQPQFASPFPGLPFITATRAPVSASATPTLTPTRTGTLAPQISFTADATTLAAGQCTNLRWTTANVIEVFLNGQGVVGNSVQPVCPPQTTTYTLTVNTGITIETRT
ncbi:MAG: FecR domain-containing protein, partial [Anaerolineales bacterium]